MVKNPSILLESPGGTLLLETRGLGCDLFVVGGISGIPTIALSMVETSFEKVGYSTLHNSVVFVQCYTTAKL